MSQNDQPDDNKNGPRMNGKPVLVWLLIMAAVVALLQFASPPTSSIQQLGVSQVLSLAQEKKIKTLTVKPDPSGGTDSWYQVAGELEVKGADANDKSKFVAAGRLTEKEFEALRAAVGKDAFKEVPAQTGWTMFLYNVLPTLLVSGVVLFMMYRFLKNANRGAMQFAKTRARLNSTEKETTTFKDVAGCDEAKEEVKEIVDFLRDPKRFTKIGATIPKGILMVGPPGTGKTLLARAVAGEAGVPFLSISGSDFVEMFVGVGAARVRDTFEQARKLAPCIIFIDEIDAVGRQRGTGVGGGNDEREQTLNSLLVEMDGFDGQAGVIVIGATNRSDVLDAALLRPGRFDRQVFVDLPDLRGREAVLAVHAKRFQLAPSVDLARVARITTGMSGADLANLLNEGALHAGRRNRDKVEMSDMEEARDKIAFGRERKKVMDEEDRRSTAYHEAGHAVVQAVIDDGSLPLHKVTIIPRGRALGMAMYVPTKDILGYSKHRLLNYICSAMAGRIGERVVTGDVSNGASSDIKQATRLARQMVCDWGMSELGPIAFGENSEHTFLGREMSRTQSQAYSDDTARRIDQAVALIVNEQFARAEKVLSENSEAHRKIAEALLEHETLDGIHVMEIIKTGSIQTPIVGNPVIAPPREAPVSGPVPEAGTQSSPSPA
ncbi:MAG: ATP-dependent zinc metalloprotease FtsH [Verrucomicrobia bacterium]|nr:ATP-dependent zinc metalloprotease FtsH [Verrucomicrobiota bacterium]NBS03891.1 ATP-dependent zinc metalloprotease FtsH [Verrucomicrobiota bacterium]NBY36344.1 ATP-dependent zinc metalloprotease FtsH [Verrucomicrobiota bacterium]